MAGQTTSPKSISMNRYYVAPYLSIFAIGGGQFSLTDPGGARSVNGSRVLIHGTWQRDITGHYSETIIPIGARGRAKGSCMSYVEAPDVDPLNLHSLIQADTEIALVPWTPDNLDDTFGTLASQSQTQVRSFLANTFFDDQWITTTRTFRDVIAYVLHILFAAQVLGADYPDGPLTSRWNGLSTARQTAINNYLTSFNLPALTGNPTIRDAVNRLAQADYGANNPRLGGEQFGAWIP